MLLETPVQPRSGRSAPWHAGFVEPTQRAAVEPREATFNLKRAAEVAGVSPSTLRRNKDLLRQHGATITENAWKVPMSALIASGLMRRRTPPDARPEAPQGVREPVEDDVNDRLRELEREALELRHRAELAEERQRSAEQQARDARQLADALAETLEVERRMITAGPSTTPEAPAPQPPAPESNVPEPTRRPRWLWPFR